MRKVSITQKMREFALKESARREPFIRHHFNINHLNNEERNMVGFLGEFACCELFNIDWESNIRKDYLTIDDFDLIHKSKKIDVKTETIPWTILQRLLTRQISDNQLYGRRLINKGQVALLKKYDIAVFGALNRETMLEWYPLGWMTTDYLLNNYKPTDLRPDGGHYPFPGLPVHTSRLNKIENLL
ncbi:hypothetical protein OAQ12_03975 [Candidatus Marinimicrobia bacterium]|nr:hypothetical protein [Candidatus Neomarinimicrobiota bacterium]